MSYPGAKPLYDNAHRLFDDAKFLAEHGRYPASLVSSIMAIEEAGKHHLYYWKLTAPDWQPVKRRFPPKHSDKQAALTANFVALIEMRVMCKLCKHFGAANWDKAEGNDDWEKTQDFLTEGYYISQHGPTPEIRQRALDILNAVAAGVEYGVNNHPLACLMKLADDYEIEKEKWAALYVDISAEGTAITNPMQCTKDGALFWLDIANVAILSLKSSEEAEKAADAFARKYRVLPPKDKTRPKATAEDWRRMIDRRLQT